MRRLSSASGVSAALRQPFAPPGAFLCAAGAASISPGGTGGEGGRAEQGALDDVFARPVAEAFFEFFGFGVAHRRGKVRAEVARFFFDQCVVQQFAIDT
jgi:hypothetical protein